VSTPLQALRTPPSSARASLPSRRTRIVGISPLSFVGFLFLDLFNRRTGPHFFANPLTLRKLFPLVFLLGRIPCWYTPFPPSGPFRVPPFLPPPRLPLDSKYESVDFFPLIEIIPSFELFPSFGRGLFLRCFEIITFLEPFLLAELTGGSFSSPPQG